MKRRIIGLLFFCLPSLYLFCQEPFAVLEYLKNEENVVVSDAEGYRYTFLNRGMDLLPGDTISTTDASVEFQIEPEGSILKIGSFTRFKIDALSGRYGSELSDFTLLEGKVRLVTPVDSNTQYRIKTENASYSTRDADFALYFEEAGRRSAAVLDGSVSLLKPGWEEPVLLERSEKVDLFEGPFLAEPLNDVLKTEILDELTFTKLDPLLLRIPADAELAEATEEEAEKEIAPEAEEKEEEKEAEEVEGEEEEPDEEEAVEEEVPAPETAFSNFMTGLLSIFRIEAGALNIAEHTYSKIVLQPTFESDGFKAAFYLPFIYSGNMLDGTDWYRPKGNNVWSFGTDQNWAEDPNAGLSDLISDIALKIAYIHIAEREDPFYLHIGTLNTLSLGHGILMRNFENNADIPSLRRIGLDAGLDLRAFGLQTAVNDLARPEIFGGRLFFRPIPNFNAAIGLEAVSDINPAGDLPASIDAKYRSADPIFLMMGAGLDLSILDSETASLLLFSDIAAYLPYISDTAGSVIPGLKSEVLFTSNPFSLRSFGWMSGIYGDVSFLDFRLDFRYDTGLFHTEFYNRVYNRLRGMYVMNLVDFLEDPSDSRFSEIRMGLNTELGFRIGDHARFDIGYLWPWAAGDGAQLYGTDEDLFRIGFELSEGFLPIGLSASLDYSRTRFFPTIFFGNDENGKTLTLFDEFSTFQSRIAYTVTEGVQISASLTTAALYSDNGKLRYDGDKVEMGTSITIETRLGF